ncbi:MAG: glycosyltransferase, partial [bacterium]
MVDAILIPAHNEEVVIARTLTGLLKGLDAGVRVLVICNGCSDGTAQASRAFAPRVEVLDLPEGSKPRAMNHGEAHLAQEPDTVGARVFMDADVELTGEEMQHLLAALARPGVLAAEPGSRYETSHSSLSVRAFYNVWTGLHGGQRGDLGGGVCGVSAEGRKRFGEFPDIIADDGYLRAHFAADEIITVPQACSVVYAARNLADHTRVHSRMRAGIYELAAEYPELWASKRRTTKSLVRKALGLPMANWPLIPLYLWAQWRIRSRARVLFEASAPIPWESDSRLL